MSHTPDESPGGRARQSGEHYTWRSLWLGASSLADRGRRDEEGNWWLTLSAMLLAFAALEAYLNYIGPELCPAEWADEKAFFSKGDYRGTLGKLAFLMNHCALPIDRGRKPWQLLKDLNRRRDKLVHPRSEAWDREVAFKDVKELGRIDAEFLQLVDESFVDDAMTAIQVVCDPLHEAASRLVGGGPAFGTSAFLGMLGVQGSAILQLPDAKRSRDSDERAT